MITVCNYSTYQDFDGTDRTANEQRLNSERTANEQPVNTSKEGKKGRREEESPNGDSGVRKKRKRTPFVPPTVAEVDAYCKSRNNGIDAEAFCAYYAATDWRFRDSNALMTNWKAAVVTWEKRRNSSGTNGQQSLYPELKPA